MLSVIIKRLKKFCTRNCSHSFNSKVQTTLRNSLVQTIRGFDVKHGFKSQLKEHFLKL